MSSRSCTLKCYYLLASLKIAPTQEKEPQNLTHTRTELQGLEPGGGPDLWLGWHCAPRIAQYFCSPQQRHYGEEINRMLMVILLSESKTLIHRFYVEL